MNMNRTGFTLAELLIATIVAAILGTALARLLVNDSKFVSRQEAMLGARGTARTAMNWTTSELRMVTDGGLIAAAPDSVRVRVPYAFGLVCGFAGLSRVVSLLPVDSVQYAMATPSRLAWRSGATTYDFPASLVLSASSDTTACTDDSIRVFPGGRLLRVAVLDLPPVGSIAYLYERVTYRFAPSSDLPGRIGLWRKRGSAAYEELVAPFDTSASFGFLVGSSTTALDNPPADLGTVTGLELRLVGASDFVPRGAPKAQTFELVTQVRFHNKAN